MISALTIIEGEGFNVWKYEHSIITEAKPESIWALYRNIYDWKKWDKEIIDVMLDGPFEKGGTGYLTLNE